MKKKFLILSIILLTIIKVSAQNADREKITDSILTEGKALFKSEWASWYGTDIFFAKCKDKQHQIGGYVSYETQTGVNNIFISKADIPVVLATISFGNNFDENSYKLDSVTREMNDLEKQLVSIRKVAVQRMSIDTTFKHFNNTSLNPVPLIQSGEKKVYILTGPKVDGVVVFGNDYLINFDKNDQIVNVKRLHKNIMPIEYKQTGTDSSKIQTSAMHSHLPETGDFITATDICTLMLYEKFTTWKQYYVLSRNYVSIWDCKKNTLSEMTMKAWENIGKDQGKRHPNN